MNPIILETDLGRDPDDFFAFLYLLQSGREIAAITLSPGDPDQVAFARWACSKVGLNIPIGKARDPKEERLSLSGPHLKMLERDKAPKTAKADGEGEDIIRAQFEKHPDTDVYICGPVKNLGRYLRSGGEVGDNSKLVMQGGFVSYQIYPGQSVRLDKFEGLETCPTFNLGGDKSGSEALLQRNGVTFVGKNLCHTIYYTREIHEGLKRSGFIYEFFGREMDQYLEEKPAKVMHDVIGAVALNHPEIFTFLDGELYREKGAYGTRVYPMRHKMAVDVDREALWAHILQGT